MYRGPAICLGSSVFVTAICIGNFGVFEIAKGGKIFACILGIVCPPGFFFTVIKFCFCALVEQNAEFIGRIISVFGFIDNNGIRYGIFIELLGVTGNPIISLFGQRYGDYICSGIDESDFCRTFGRRYRSRLSPLRLLHRYCHDFRIKTPVYIGSAEHKLLFEGTVSAFSIVAEFQIAVLNGFQFFGIYAVFDFGRKVGKFYLVASG